MLRSHLVYRFIDKKFKELCRMVSLFFAEFKVRAFKVEQRTSAAKSLECRRILSRRNEQWGKSIFLQQPVNVLFTQLAQPSPFFRSEIKVLLKTSYILIIAVCSYKSCLFMPSMGPPQCQLCNEIKANRENSAMFLHRHRTAARRWTADCQEKKWLRYAASCSARCFIC